MNLKPLAILGIPLILAGCAATQPSQKPQPSATDPIAEAQWIKYASDELYGTLSGQAILMLGKSVESTYAAYNFPTHRIFDHTWEQCASSITNSLMGMRTSGLNNFFNQVCSNVGGTMEMGWCVDSLTKENPLFWARGTVWKKPTKDPDAGWMTALYVMTPPPGKDAKDPSWVSFAKGQGFLSRSDKKKQTEEMLAAGKGIMVCRKVTQGPRPNQKGEDKGYIEDVANKRLKIRIFSEVIDRQEYSSLRGSNKDSNNRTIWDQPSNWYMCQ
jgi:hypothetical protein